MMDAEDEIPKVTTLSRGQNVLGVHRNGRTGVLIYLHHEFEGRTLDAPDQLHQERISVRPGAISVRGLNNNLAGDESVASNQGSQPDVIDTPFDQDDSEPQIVARLASEVDIGSRVAAQLETRVELMLQDRMEEMRRTAVVADRVGSTSTLRRKKHRTLCIMVMIVSAAVAGLVGGLMYGVKGMVRIHRRCPRGLQQHHPVWLHRSVPWILS